MDNSKIVVPEEIAAKIDAKVVDGKVYIALNELISLNSYMAQSALMAGVIRGLEDAATSSMLQGVSWSLDTYRAVCDCLTARFAAEIVPDTVEALDK